ncbi:hypothetical protein JXC34_01300 [Candidatus Woesearchaeota archaeon]|nr:hypothetical protein [Candidatus Woesearchaeota archaeon]
MRKAIIIVLVVLALMTMAQTCESETTTANTNPFKGGTRGLALQFLEGSPPEDVFDSNSYPFSVVVKLMNVGEADVAKNDVQIKLSGINPTDFGKTESDFIKNSPDDVIATIFDSEGNTIEPPPAFIEFENLRFVHTLPGNNQFPIRADVCYAYKTEAFADGCIRADVLSADKDAVCQIYEEKAVFNSGAPIHIAEFTEQPSGQNKIRYVFKIQHKGSGKFYLPGTKCPSDDSSRISRNRVHFRIDSNVQDLQCSPLLGGQSGKEGEVLLVDGEATVHCTQQTTSNLDFIDKLHITLTYDYREFIEQQLLVKKSVT